ncbi:MAG TPA: FHA domain-containing protein [Longimicrobiales bacterium]
MRVQIHILTGARAGHAFTFSGETITVGRHADSDLRLDPERDLTVSAHHALIWNGGDRWLVRDLDSRNGTFVNGERVEGDTVLSDADRITFGAGGPVVEFRILDAVAAAAVALGRRPPHPDATPPTPPPAGMPSPTTERIRAEVVPPTGTPSSTERIRVEVARQTRRLRGALIALALALLAIAIVFLYTRQRQRESWGRERAALEQRIDSILTAGERAMHSLQGELDGLAAALRESHHEVRELRTELRRAHESGDGSRIATLERRLQAATTALERQQLAASMDFRAIERANRSAVALIYVESRSGEVATATAFAVRPDATLVTNRHVLHGPDGTDRPRRIAVQFSDSEQIWPARVLAVSETSDVALVKVDNIADEVPTIRSLNARADTIGIGAPIASIGFPLGGALPDPTSGGARPAQPLIIAGVVSRTAGDHIEFLGYGAAGASGSPIFDENGEVIAIVFAGRDDDAGHAVLGVPAAAVVELLGRTR